MKYKTEPFKDRAELYAWAGEKKDIYVGEVMYHYGENGYNLAFDARLQQYKKVIYPKTKQYWLWDLCDDDGFCRRTTSFIDENGLDTKNETYTKDWNKLKKRKVEDSLLEIEE